jgi:hypothetical protein
MSRFAVRTAALLLAVALTGLAFAATAYIEIERRITPEQMHETGLDTLTPAQLAALNRVLREDAAKRAAVSAPSGSTQSTDPSRHVGMSDAPIRSRVKGVVAGWAPGTVFELENGQQWKVLKGEMKLPKAMTSPEIVVAPGVAGRWFLQVSEDFPKARIYRVD